MSRKSFVRRAACVYPTAWRERYAAEFDALLDAAPLRWRDVADVLKGALIMQLTIWKSYRKAAVCAGFAGAVVALAVAFAIPDEWAATATLQATSQQTDGTLEAAELRVLRHNNLVAMIRAPYLDLYQKERARLPMQEVVTRMRQDIRIAAAGAGRSTPPSFSIRYSYPDRIKASRVVERLVDEFQTELRPQTGEAALTVIDPPLVPERPYGPNRLIILLAGLSAGLVSGPLYVRSRRRARTGRNLQAES